MTPIELAVVAGFLGPFAMQEVLRVHGSAAAARAVARFEPVVVISGIVFVSLILWKLVALVR
jgi:hypothetical protein